MIIVSVAGLIYSSYRANLNAARSLRGWQKALDLNNEILKEWQEDCSYIALLEMELIKRNIDPPEGEWRSWKERFPKPDKDYLATLSIDDVLD